MHSRNKNIVLWKTERVLKVDGALGRNLFCFLEVVSWEGILMII